LQILIDDIQDWHANEIMLRKRLYEKEEEKKDRDEYLKQTLKNIKNE